MQYCYVSVPYVFRLYEKIYVELSTAPLSHVLKRTGCNQPCNYKDYKFLNTNLNELTYYDYPADQVVFCLWAVSQYTQVFVLSSFYMCICLILALSILILLFTTSVFLIPLPRL